jgi:membrane-associated protein
LWLCLFTGRFITIRCRHFCAGVHNDIGQTELNLGITLLLLIIAAIVGDALNYFIGKNIGLKLLNWKLNDKQIVNSKYIAKTNKFYELHGPKTIIIARFIPIVRTLPFCSRNWEMTYGKFIRFNMIEQLYGF